MSATSPPASPLRVTHVIPQIGIGGAELQLCRLARDSSPGRVRHRVLYYSDALDTVGLKIFENAGVRLERVDRRGGHVRFAWRLARAVAHGSPDILHCWLVSAALWGRLAGRLAGVRDIVLSFRSTIVDEVPALRLARLLDGRAVRYLANNASVAEAIRGAVGVPLRRIAVIPNGLDVRDYDVPGDRPGLLAEHGCPPDARVVLTVGRLTAAKNYAMLLRIAARVAATDKVHFFIAGHGELEADLKGEAGRRGVLGRVHFLGLRQDIPALMAAADVFCYTSRFEGFPNALLEAMASGRPIVTTRFEGVDGLIDADRTGVVVAQDDDAAAFDAIRRLLAHPAEAAALGAAARRRAADSFSTTRMVTSTLEYYESAHRRG